MRGGQAEIGIWEINWLQIGWPEIDYSLLEDEPLVSDPHRVISSSPASWFQSRHESEESEDLISDWMIHPQSEDTCSAIIIIKSHDRVVDNLYPTEMMRNSWRRVTLISSRVLREKRGDPHHLLIGFRSYHDNHLSCFKWHLSPLNFLTYSRVNDMNNEHPSPTADHMQSWQFSCLVVFLLSLNYVCLKGLLSSFMSESGRDLISCFLNLIHWWVLKQQKTEWIYSFVPIFVVIFLLVVFAAAYFRCGERKRRREKKRRWSSASLLSSGNNGNNCSPRLTSSQVR